MTVVDAKEWASATCSCGTRFLRTTDHQGDDCRRCQSARKRPHTPKDGAA